MFPSSARLQASAAYTRLLGTLKADLKQAMIRKQNVEKTTIRSILLTVKNHEIDGGKHDEFEMSKVLAKMVKQRTDSAAEYKKQDRQDLAHVELQESDLIQRYLKSLPVASTEEVKAELTKYLTKLNADKPEMKIGDVFKLITDDLAHQWKTSPLTARAMVPGLFKIIFKPGN